jgi:PKHD-type hydroxylase
VAPVTRGQRLVAITWIQSLVPDAEERSILTSLGDALITLQAANASEPALNRLRQVQHKLLRRWARA